MLRRILIASAAAAMLLVTFAPDDADARGRGGGGYRGGGGGYRGGAVAVRGARGRRCRSAAGARLSGWGLSRLRLSRLRCRCGGGGRRCGRSRCGRGLPRQLLRRLRQLRLRRRVPSVRAARRGWPMVLEADDEVICISEPYRNLVREQRGLGSEKERGRLSWRPFRNPTTFVPLLAEGNREALKILVNYRSPVVRVRCCKGQGCWRLQGPSSLD